MTVRLPQIQEIINIIETEHKMQSEFFSMPEKEMPYNVSTETIKKIEGIILNLLSSTDFENEQKRYTLISNLIHVTSLLYKDSILKFEPGSVINKINSTITVIHYFSKYSMRNEHISVDSKIEKEKHSFEIPENLSYASIVIDAGIDDKAMKNSCIEILEQAVCPLILSSRTLHSLLPNLQRISQTKNYLFLKNKEGDLFICIPKQGKNEEEILKSCSYDTSQLEVVKFGELKSKIDPFIKRSDEEYLSSIASNLPKLFTNSKIKKRFNIIGHSSADGVLGSLKAQQLRKVLEQLENLGMDYLNYDCCYAGGQNLIKVFNFPHHFSVSVCSVGDYITGVHSFPSDSYVKLNYRNHSLFWEEITKAFEGNLKEGKKSKIKIKHIQKALENIYGHDSSAFPVVSFQGTPSFQSINVDNRIAVLSYEKMYSDQLHLNELHHIPFKSIQSTWAQSEHLKDRINHCDQQIQACDQGLLLLSEKDVNWHLLRKIEEKYTKLRGIYESMTKGGKFDVASFSKENDNLLKEIIQLEVELNQTPFASKELSPNKLKHFIVDKEYFFIYPQVIRQPIFLKKVKGSFPFFVSKVPDHNQTLFLSVQTTEGLPIDVLRSSFLRPEFTKVLASSTNHYFIIKELKCELNGQTAAFENVIISKLEDKSTAIFQKRENPGVWFTCSENGQEKIISKEEVYQFLEALKKEFKTTETAVNYSAGDLLPAKQTMQYFHDIYRDFLKSIHDSQ